MRSFVAGLSGCEHCEKRVSEKVLSGGDVAGVVLSGADSGLDTGKQETQFHLQDSSKFKFNSSNRHEICRASMHSAQGTLCGRNDNAVGGTIKRPMKPKLTILFRKIFPKSATVKTKDRSVCGIVLKTSARIVHAFGHILSNFFLMCASLCV